ncbi:MAG: hypothetical protein JXA14_10005 [Anaerolineae bacterium]|nr:hypothetical protein [Anaerolineae bacterium]
MNVEHFKRFLELQGRKVIESVSGYWYNAGGGVYLSIPYTRTIDPDPTELAELFCRHRILGVKYSTADRTRGHPGAIYVVRDKTYGLRNMKRTARACVRKGLERCTVRQINFDYLQEHGLRLNADTMERQYRDDPFFGDPARWARLCQAGRQVKGASAWGAFVGEQLAAYMIGFLIDDCYNILHEMSRTDLRDFYPNHVLQYTVIREAIIMPNVCSVSAGLESIFEIPGLDRFKRHAGYEKLPRNYIVVLHPVLRAILLGRLGRMILDAAHRRFPQHDRIKRVHATANMARLSLL